MPPAQKPIRREIELDFIRGIAILLVVDFHSPKSWLFTPFRLLGFQPFGWAGVDLFFILSGFLVGGLLVKEWRLKGRIASGSFLIRRGLKIWPPYYVFLAVSLATRHRTFHELRGNLLNIQNYTGGIPFTWSLAVEEHAYLFLTLFLAIAAVFTLRMRTLFFTLAGLSAAVVALRTWVSTRGASDIYDPTHLRIEGIFYGVLLAMLYHYRPQTYRKLQTLYWLWLPVLALGLLFLRFHSASVLTGSLLIDTSNFMAVALLLLLYRHKPASPQQAAQRNPLYRFIAWVGLYSYGIYLWHVSVDGPIVSLAAHLPHPAAVLWLGLAPIAVGLVIGILATKLIEFPTLKLRDRLFPRRVDSAVGVPAETEAASDVDPTQSVILLETEPGT